MQSRYNMDEILKTASGSGRFGRFVLDSISYYPALETRRGIAKRIYGFEDVSRAHLASPELYRKFREKVENGSLIDPGKPLNHQKVEGEFLLLPEEKITRGVLGVAKIITDNPDIDMSIISPNAFFPHYHQVRYTHIPSGDGSISLYTKDADGSDWSIHCR